MASGKHARQRGPRRWLTVGTGTALVVLVAAGGYAITRGGDSPGTPAASAEPDVDPTELQVTPANGAADISLTSTIVVHITTGRLGNVVATDPSGTAATGTLDADGTTWRASGPFAASTVYTVTADGTTEKGHLLHVVSTFTTLTPSDVLTPKITPSDGLTVGVGQPIVVRFNDDVADKDAMLRRFDLTMSDNVTGAWHWFSDKEVHYRPKEYWPSGEDITLAIDLTGYDNGDGVWGDGTSSSHFSIGDARVSTVDLSTHEMTVTQNGEVVNTFPVSAGRDKYPTMTGTHIALYRQQDVLMDSSTVGIPRNSADGYYEHVYWDVAITDGGEFVHAAPWSTGSQGSSNVSHGCVNLSTADAEWFFNFSRMGDVINVVNGPREPEVGDHGVMDWETPWDVWSPPSAPPPGVQ